VIEIYKFRSLHHRHADPSASQDGDQERSRASPGWAASSGKRRSTSCRSSSTCWRGELSLVGPRPARRVEATTANKLWEEVVDGYFSRATRVKPGITGWAQINGLARRGQHAPESCRNRVEHDLYYYIENWSLLFDLYILTRTPFALLNTENAY